MRLPGSPPVTVPDQLWADFSAFHEGMLISGDIDPVYPVLHATLGDLDEDQRVTGLLLYVAYYHLGSGLTALEHFMAGTRLEDLPMALPTGTERRGHRSHAQFRVHLQGLQRTLDHHGSFCRALQAKSDDPAEAFEQVAANVQTIPGNGRWAGYKTAELLWKVGGWSLRAESLGLEGSSGPLAGLKMLVGPHPLLKVPGGAERLGRRVVRALDRPELRAWPEQVETALCDFHSMVQGRYYVGADTDMMMTQLSAVPQGVFVRRAWAARRAVLPERFLGEVGGWTGVRKPLKRLYMDRGLLAWWDCPGLDRSTGLPSTPGSSSAITGP